MEFGVERFERVRVDLGEGPDTLVLEGSGADGRFHLSAVRDRLEVDPGT